MAANAGSIWSHAETVAFIQIVNEDDIEQILTGIHKNKHVFQTVARRLTDQGFD